MSERSEPRYLSRADVVRLELRLTEGHSIPRRDLRALLRTAHQLYLQRHALAKLAADTPQFDNPLIAWETQSLRDAVLANPREIYTTESREYVTR